MNKLLTAGLVAAVAMTSANASQCGNGGFYAGVNAGLAFSKAKVKKEAHTYAADEVYGGEDTKWKVAADDADISGANSKLIKVSHANARSELMEGLLKASKKKTKFLAELVLGYDFRMNDVMMGAELLVGGVFGSNKLKNDSVTTNANAGTEPKSSTMGGANAEVKDAYKAGEYATIKEQWHIALMPRIGYLFTPQFEGYVTFGLKIAKWKTDVKNLLETNLTNEGSAVANRADLQKQTKSYKKSATRAQFVIGAGVRYEITPEFFTKLEYNFETKGKGKLHKNAMPEVKSIKVQNHVVKLGLGYRF